MQIVLEGVSLTFSKPNALSMSLKRLALRGPGGESVTSMKRSREPNGESLSHIQHQVKDKTFKMVPVMSQFLYREIQSLMNITIIVLSLFFWSF